MANWSRPIRLDVIMHLRRQACSSEGTGAKPPNFLHIRNHIQKTGDHGEKIVESGQRHINVLTMSEQQIIGQCSDQRVEHPEYSS
jgi:hypothetical protein